MRNALQRTNFSQQTLSLCVIGIGILRNTLNRLSDGMAGCPLLMGGGSNFAGGLDRTLASLGNRLQSGFGIGRQAGRFLCLTGNLLGVFSSPGRS